MQTRALARSALCGKVMRRAAEDSSHDTITRLHMHAQMSAHMSAHAFGRMFAQVPGPCAHAYTHVYAHALCMRMST